jgi:mono/diheme cytochrome c family protein
MLALRKRASVWLALIAAALAMLPTGCNRPRSVENLAPPASPARTSSAAYPAATPEPSAVEDGQNIFLANCTGCHGRNADASTPAGRAWHVPDLHSAVVQQTSDAQLLQILRDGKGKMPPWGGLLSPIDLNHVLAYVRTLKNQ